MPRDADGALILLGDMPWVTARTIDRLIAAFDPAGGRDVVVPMRRGQRGNPVLWGRPHFTAMSGIAGDVGARQRLDAVLDRVVGVDIDSDGILFDIDTPSALAEATAQA